MNKPTDSRQTHFAPAGRDSRTTLQQEAERIHATPMLQRMIEAFGEAVVILNKRRQIVAANRTALEMVSHSLNDALGQRPGELLGCRHVTEGPDGCGTSRHCAVCGAVQAVLDSQRQRRSDHTRVSDCPRGAGRRSARSAGPRHDRLCRRRTVHDLLPERCQRRKTTRCPDADVLP